MKKLLKLWSMWQLAIEGKFLFFKTLATSIIAHLTLVKDLSSTTMAQLEKLPKELFGKKMNSCDIMQYSAVIFLQKGTLIISVIFLKIAVR